MLVRAAIAAALLPACGGTSPSLSSVERSDAGADAASDCGSDDCSGNATDSGRPVGPGLLGQPCVVGGECSTGLCFDGVCCDRDCSASCWSCAQIGTIGSCLPADPGTDPRADCADDGLASCGTDGACDGSGSCRRYPTGLVCAAATCEGTTLTQAFRCSGAGECRPTSGVPCDPYVCDSNQARCLTTCTSSADCTPGRVCIAGRCGKNPLGAPCASRDDCNSDLCEQSVCCVTTCTGTCRSCALAGSAGTCTAVPAGQDPLDHCVDQSAASCGTNGSCDGAGACQHYPASTICIPASCATPVFTPAGTCDGAGTCRPPVAIDCGPYACATTGCRTTCVTAADCATGDVCILGACGAPTNLKLQYLCGATAGAETGAKPELRLVNQASTPVPLTQITVRYWYTVDGTPTQSAAVDYADVGAVNVIPSFVRLPMARPTADFYLQIGFTAAAGSLAGNGAVTAILARFNKTDFTQYDQTNDYSFDASKTTFADWDRITVYRNGVLAWGTEPAGAQAGQEPRSP